MTPARARGPDVDFDAVAEAISPQQFAEAVGAERTASGWRCPLGEERHSHGDQDPSFSVFRDGERTAARCHGCGLRGSPVTVASEVWGVEPVEAARRLAREIGLAVAGAGRNRGWTVEDYASYVDVPAQFLSSQFNVQTHREPGKSPSVAIPYRDARGETIRTRYRTRDRFWWGSDGDGVALYGLDRLAAADPSRVILLVEGESDVHACARHDLLAVGVPGASSWRSSWARELEGRDVYVWREPDQGGDQLVADVAEDLLRARVMEAPEDAADPADLHRAAGDEFGARLAGLREGARPIRQVVAGLEHHGGGEGEDEEDDDETQKAQLLRHAGGHVLFTDDRDRAYAWIERGGHRETWPVEGRTFRSWLAHKFWRATGDVPGSSVLGDVLTVLAGRARFEGPSYELANRAARAEDGAIWYDLADDDWRAVRVDADGWELVPGGPPQPTFRRFAHQEAQVEPVPGGDLAELLLPFLNVPEADEGEPDADNHARVLALVWPVVALVPDIPRTISIPWGRQGSAKSTLARVYRKIVDPSATPMPRFPRGDAEMAQVLDHHAAPFFDNVSSLSQRESDTLCRAVTGDGFSKRKLYTDDEDVLYRFRRAILLNGINVPAQRPDLLDRSVLLRMEKIEEEDRVEERAFWRAFEEARPRIFGAVLDALSVAMRLEPEVRLGALPRMADWTRWGYAVAEALGLGGDMFLAAYRANRSAADEEALGSHPVGAAVVAFMEDREEEWIGQPSALLRELEDVAEREKIDTGHKLWPGAPNWLSRRINEVEHNLQKAGIRWDRGEGDDRFVRLWREEEECAEDAEGAEGAEEAPAAFGDSDPRHAPGTPRQGEDAEGMLGGSEPTPRKGSPGTPGTPGISQIPQSDDVPASGDGVAEDAEGAEGAAVPETGDLFGDDEPADPDDVEAL